MVNKLNSSLFTSSANYATPTTKWTNSTDMSHGSEQIRCIIHDVFNKHTRRVSTAYYGKTCKKVKSYKKLFLHVMVCQFNCCKKYVSVTPNAPGAGDYT